MDPCLGADWEGMVAGTEFGLMHLHHGGGGPLASCFSWVLVYLWWTSLGVALPSLSMPDGSCLGVPSPTLCGETGFSGQQWWFLSLHFCVHLILAAVAPRRGALTPGPRTDSSTRGPLQV